MRLVRLVTLGARLATAGGRSSWARLGLMSLGFAIGSGLLLSAMSVPPAMGARDDRLYGVAGHAPRAQETDVLLVWGADQYHQDEQVDVSVVEPLGHAPTPAGLATIPAPGEMYISEALAERWRTPIGAALTRRLEAVVVGTIARDAVEGPATLAVWVGKPTDIELPRRDALAIESFSPVSAETSEPADLGALLTLVGIASAVLLPIWLFVATATRLSAATREARLAAVRLSGGTQGEVRLLAAVEAGVAAAAGTLIGIPLFILLRTVLASGLILDIRFYADDFAPPLWLALIVVVGLPVLAVAISLVTMRRLLVSPLGVARQAGRRHAGWWWTIVLATGIATLAWSASQHEALTQRSEAGAVVGLSLALTAFGLIGSATWSAWVIARWLATRVGSVSVLLGMRRLESDPSSVGRVVGSVALVIAMVGVLQSGLVAAGAANSGYLPRWIRALPPGSVLVQSRYLGPGRDLPSLGEIEGVESVRITRRTPYGGTSTRRTAVLHTDGQSETLEAIRDRTAYSADVITVRQRREDHGVASAEYASILRGLWILTLFLLVVNAGTLLVAMVDWIMERRRSLSLLSAVGAEARVLRRSILAQVALPLATAVAFGLAGAVTVVTLLYTAVETEVSLPLRELAVLAMVVATLVLGVTAVSMPWMKAARRPTLLRSA